MVRRKNSRQTSRRKISRKPASRRKPTTRRKTSKRTTSKRKTSKRKTSKRKTSKRKRVAPKKVTKIIVIGRPGASPTMPGSGVTPKTVVGPGGIKKCQPSTGWAKNYSGGYSKVNYRPCPPGSSRAGICVRQDHVSEYDNFFTRCGMR